jgi:hypothetical protein
MTCPRLPLSAWPNVLVSSLGQFECQGHPCRATKGRSTGHVRLHTQGEPYRALRSNLINGLTCGLLIWFTMRYSPVVLVKHPAIFMLKWQSAPPTIALIRHARAVSLRGGWPVTRCGARRSGSNCLPSFAIHYLRSVRPSTCRLAPVTLFLSLGERPWKRWSSRCSRHL